jgi:hypothetical protein
MNAGRGLKAVLEAINRKAADVALEQLEVGKDAIRKAACETLELSADQAPVFTRSRSSHETWRDRC